MDTVEPRLHIPQVIERFRAYHAQHPAWGSLHVVLDDGNVQDSSVRHCIAYALAEGDTEGAELGQVLLRLSRTQRLKLPRIVHLTEQTRDLR